MQQLKDSVSTLFFGLAAISTPLEASAQPLKSVKWKSRPLLIFAPSSDHPLFMKQRAMMRQVRSGLTERAMIVIEIVGNTRRTILGPGPQASAITLRSHYGIGKSAFRVILVGKDGGRKLISRNVVSSRELFGLIDSMPMRRDEMRRSSQ